MRREKSKLDRQARADEYR